MRYPSVQAKTVLVTGCSSGIGAATALFLRDKGWNVVPTARKPDDLDRLRAQGFTPVHLELANSESVVKAAEDALRLFDGQVGGLVNNAGYGQPGAIEDLTRDQMRQQFEVNVFGLQELTNRLIPVFRKQGWGRIVNISSVVGRVAIPFSAAYGSSKFALEGLSDALRVELRNTGIAVSIVEPGPIDTRFYGNATERARGLLEVKDSRFADDYKRAVGGEAPRKVVRELFMKPPEAVAAKIQHALESSHPRTRYLVTLPAHAASILRRLAPDVLIDYVVLRRAAKRRE